MGSGLRCHELEPIEAAHPVEQRHDAGGGLRRYVVTPSLGWPAPFLALVLVEIDQSLDPRFQVQFAEVVEIGMDVEMAAI